MGSTKISVIIPVYNVEKYLEKCLNSIINQTMVELEIICVNDGSTDNSTQILESFAAKDDRIKVFHKENGGIASARNLGLKHVTGDYIGFVDSDDWIELNMYEKLYDKALENDCDMVMCSAHRFEEDTGELIYNNPYFTLGHFDESFDGIIFDHKAVANILFYINVTPWNKIYKTSLIQENNITFPEGLEFEDNPFFYETFLKAKRISLIREHLYFYRVNREGSFIKTGNRRFFDIVPILNLVDNIIQENFPEVRDHFLNIKLDNIISRYTQVDAAYKPEFLEIIKEDLIKMNPEDLKKLNDSNQARYRNLFEARDYREYDLFEKTIRTEKLMNERLLLQSKEYENKLKQQKIAFDKEISYKNQLIKEMQSSNSWKITKPIRSLGNILKKT